MASLLAQVGSPSPFFPLREAHPQLDQLGHPGRPFLDNPAHHLLATKPGTGFQRVAYVELVGILRRGHAGDSPLGIVGVGLDRVFLGQKQHRSVPGRLEGKT